MKGTFRATDGRLHEGAFAFVGIDISEPDPGPQVHHLNPSEQHPKGVFWTTAVPWGSVKTTLRDGRATVDVAGLRVFDYGDTLNAVRGGGPAAVPYTMSFRVEWGKGGVARPVWNEVDGHAGHFTYGSARMEWHALGSDFAFKSDPLGASSSSFALIGHERNGRFFKDGKRRFLATT